MRKKIEDLFKREIQPFKERWAKRRAAAVRFLAHRLYGASNCMGGIFTGKVNFHPSFTFLKGGGIFVLMLGKSDSGSDCQCRKENKTHEHREISTRLFSSVEGRECPKSAHKRWKTPLIYPQRGWYTCPLPIGQVRAHVLLGWLI